jgi:serine/threonine-protein kinase RsbW
MNQSQQAQIKLECPSEPGTVTSLRRRAAKFAADQGAGAELVADVNLAISEAVTNAVKYAKEAAGKGTIGLAAEAEGGWLEFRITDDGETFGRGSSDGLGLGLAIIARLCDDLRIVQEGLGTTVLMRFALR